MKRKNIIQLIALMIIPFIMLGCFDEQDFDLSDENKLEWAPPNPSTGQLSHTAEFEADSDESQTVDFTVQLIGAHEDHDRTASITVNEEASEAEEGVHFELLDQQITIAANSSSDEVTVEFFADEIENGAEYFAQLELEESDELGVAANMAELDLSMEKSEVEFGADLEGSEEYEDVSGSVSVEGNTSEEMFEAGISLTELEEDNTYEWAMYEGTCENEEGMLGAGEDYEELVTEEEEHSASAEAEVDFRLWQNDEYHVRVYEDALLGDDLVVCGDL